MDQWKGFSKLRDVRREDCLCSEQDHPEFPIEEEGRLENIGIRPNVNFIKRNGF